MGLDITAYSRLTPVGIHTTDDEWCYDYDHHVKAFAYADFPQSFRGLAVLRTRVVGNTPIIDGGCYEFTDATIRHAFRAGSYTGYGHWRSGLAAQFNPDTDPDGPFYELIWFADNEGSIGPEAAKDLQADFEQHAAQYKGENYDQQKYADWLRACDLAADSGLISFH